MATETDAEWQRQEAERKEADHINRIGKKGAGFNDGLWHGWNGGECPVHSLSEISVCLLNGGTFHEVLAKDVAQSHWVDGIVVAFRVVKEHRDLREWWIVPGFAKTPFSIPEYDMKPCFGAIRVREVLDDEGGAA